MMKLIIDDFEQEAGLMVSEAVSITGGAAPWCHEVMGTKIFSNKFHLLRCLQLRAKKSFPVEK